MQLHVVDGHLVENIGAEWNFRGFAFDENKGLEVLVKDQDIAAFGQAIYFDSPFNGDAVVVVAFFLEQVLHHQLSNKFFWLQNQPLFADRIKNIALLILRFDLKCIHEG